MVTVISGTKPYYSNGGSDEWGCDRFKNGCCPGFMWQSCSQGTGYFACSFLSEGCTSLGTAKPIDPSGVTYNTNAYCQNGQSGPPVYSFSPNFGQGCIGNRTGPCPGKCFYSLDDITSSSENVDAYYNLYCTDSTDGFCTGPNQASYNTIMAEFCKKSSTKCPQIPNTTNGTPTVPATCSNMIAVGDNSRCYSWSQSMKFQGSVDGAMAQYCGSNPNALECGCINRANNSEYAVVRAGIEAVNDVCWWGPCQNPGLYLVPPEYTDRLKQPNTCPANICQQVVINAKNTGTTINENGAKWSISCTNQAGGGGSSGGGSFSNNTTVWVKNNWWVIVIIAVALFIVVIGFVIVIIVVVSKKNKSKTSISKETLKESSKAVSNGSSKESSKVVSKSK